MLAVLGQQVSPVLHLKLWSLCVEINRLLYMLAMLIWSSDGGFMATFLLCVCPLKRN